MIDPEIQAFGRRILAWVERMRPLAEAPEKTFANKKWKEAQKENDKVSANPGKSFQMGRNNGE